MVIDFVSWYHWEEGKRVYKKKKFNFMTWTFMPDLFCQIKLSCSIRNVCLRFFLPLFLIIAYLCTFVRRLYWQLKHKKLWTLLNMHIKVFQWEVPTSEVSFSDKQKKNPLKYSNSKIQKKILFYKYCSFRKTVLDV